MAIRKRPDNAPEERLEASRISLAQLASACGDAVRRVPVPLGPAQRTNRLSLVRAADEGRGEDRHPDHDHGAPDPEPVHVTGHEAAWDVAEALTGEHRAHQNNQHADDAGASSHGNQYPARLRAIHTPP